VGKQREERGRRVYGGKVGEKREMGKARRGSGFRGKKKRPLSGEEAKNGRGDMDSRGEKFVLAHGSADQRRKTGETHELRPEKLHQGMEKPDIST